MTPMKVKAVATAAPIHTADDPVEEELRSLIDDLSIDEQIDLVAICWLGRDDGNVAWTDIRARLPKPTIAMPPATCSVTRCWRIIWTKVWPRWAIPARTSSASIFNAAAMAGT